MNHRSKAGKRARIRADFEILRAEQEAMKSREVRLVHPVTRQKTTIPWVG